VTWAFKDLRPISGVGIGSYQDLITRKFVPVTARIDGAVYTKRLQAIGHLTDPNKVAMPLVTEGDDAPDAPKPIAPQTWGLYAYLNNQAIEMKRQGKSKEAIETFQKAIDLNPQRPTPYLNMAMLLMEKQQYTSADALLFKALTLGLPNPEKYVLDMSAYYRQHDMPTRAIAVLGRARQLLPQSYLIAANLGSALAESDRFTEAQPELERALAMQPSSSQVLNNLGLIWYKKKDPGRALDYWNRSLAIDPRQPQIREAVAAVRSRI
jgi:Tfp pilus assembly protein PilF